MPKYPVYIPTKGRCGNVATAETLEEDGVDYKLFVEPAEVEEYAEKYGADKIVEVEDDDQGLGPTLNEILEYSEDVGCDWHWQLDDDVGAFYIRRGGEVERTGPDEVMRYCEKFVERYKNIGMASPRSSNWMAKQDKPFSLNLPPLIVKLIRTGMPYRFRHCQTDTDHALQMLNDGWCTVRFNAFGFSKVASSAELEGGLTDYYRNDGFIDKVRRLQSFWPRTFDVERRSGDPKAVYNQIFSNFDQTLEPKDDVEIF